MRRTAPDLLDEDLARLLRLGGGIGQIAEAAGTDAARVLERLGRMGRVGGAPSVAAAGVAAAGVAAAGVAAAGVAAAGVELLPTP